ncbi:MAG TPA: ABC transporter permease subunit [Candidatus Sulfopaludibacter sp.]|jgi:ABC-type transport system involved in multi-copper enzyme maturation permease subunit|nr:ABC transporter permease subunit [Candidatus Sulfopaludibacter sp.]
MRPLLWKEMRDLRPWLLAGLGFTGGLQVLLSTGVFGGNFVSVWMEVLLPLAAAVVAIGIAAGQVARERHTRTLEFLLVRPVPARVILWSKFLAGTAVLAVLLAALLALGYAVPGFTSDTGLQVIREQVGYRQLLVTLFPRFWFLYGMSLLFSELVDRTAKATLLAAVAGIVTVAAALRLADLAPFSSFVWWLPFFESTGGLIDAAKSPALSLTTGLVYAGSAVFLAAAAAWLLKKSPERYLGNRGLAATTVGVIAMAVASVGVAAHRLPEEKPIGVWEIEGAGDWDSSGIVASGSLVALTHADRVQFLDFHEPARPLQIDEVQLPLWTTSTEWSVDRASIEGATVYLAGSKKQMPVDDLEIAIVKPGAPVETISLGPVRPGDYASTPVRLGNMIYIATTRDRVCSLRVFELASKREVATLVIDRLRLPRTKNEGSLPVHIVRQGSYLYIGSPSFLSTVNVSNPAVPTLTSQLTVHPKATFLYGFPRPLSCQEGRLFEIRLFPESLAVYSLSDPAKPRLESELTYHAGFNIAGAGSALYQPWQSGMLEFHAGRVDLQADRYLRSNGVVSSFAVSEGLVYAMVWNALKKRRTVDVFQAGVQKENGSK